MKFKENAEWLARRWLKRADADTREAMRALLDSDEFKEIEGNDDGEGNSAGRPGDGAVPGGVPRRLGDDPPCVNCV